LELIFTKKYAKSVVQTYELSNIKGEISIRNEIPTHNLELFEIAEGSMVSGNNFFLHWHAFWPEKRRIELACG